MCFSISIYLICFGGKVMSIGISGDLRPRVLRTYLAVRYEAAQYSEEHIAFAPVLLPCCVDKRPAIALEADLFR